MSRPPFWGAQVGPPDGSFTFQAGCLPDASQPAVTGPGVWGHAQVPGLDTVPQDPTPSTGSEAWLSPTWQFLGAPSNEDPHGLSGGFPTGAPEAGNSVPL